MDLRIITGNSNTALAEEIAKHAGVNLTKRTIHRFKDGEIYVKIDESVRGEDVFVIQSVCHGVNDSLMELLIMIDALKRASAGRITAVIAYYGYARQDRKTEAREPITAKLVADMITIAGANRVLAVDLHVQQIQGFFNIPVDEISPVPLFGKYFLEKNIKDPVIVAPDAGGLKRARFLAKILRCPIAIIDKRRTMHNDADVMNIVGDIEGKTAIIIDDIIDTGNSIAKACNAVAEKANEVYLCATHPIFSNGCEERLIATKAKEIITTNTIPLVHNGHEKIKIISVARLLSDVIHNINDNRSVSELFKV